MEPKVKAQQGLSSKSSNCRISIIFGLFGEERKGNKKIKHKEHPEIQNWNEKKLPQNYLIRNSTEKHNMKQNSPAMDIDQKKPNHFTNPIPNQKIINLWTFSVTPTDQHPPNTKRVHGCWIAVNSDPTTKTNKGKQQKYR